MPSNRVSINGQENLSWEVPDSKMEAVITVLDVVGVGVGFDDRQDADRRAALEQSRTDHDHDHDRALSESIVTSSAPIREGKVRKGGVNPRPTTPRPPPPKGQGGRG